MTYNGEVDAVGGVVMMLKGANSADVVSRIKEKMQTIQKSLPPDVIIEPYLDRTDLVNRAITTVEKNLIEGALIVIFVLVLFLGNLRAGLIVASAIPSDKWKKVCSLDKAKWTYWLALPLGFLKSQVPLSQA